MKPYYSDGACEIYLGNCREILPMLPRVNLVLTDPPYDEKTTDGMMTHRNGEAIWNACPWAAFNDHEIAKSFLAQCDGWVIIWCSLEDLGKFKDIAGECYVRGGFWHKPDAMPQLTGDRPAQPGEACAILHNTGKKKWNGGGHPAFWSFPIERERHGHPTPKPYKLMTRQIAQFSNPGDLVLDAFCGSGTTLRAAKDLGRKAIGIEIEERYCEIAANRLCQEVLALA